MAEQIQTSDMVILVRRRLGVGDTTTGDYSSARVISALNLAQAWARRKLFRYKLYWLSRKTDPIILTATDTRIYFPDDFWWERRLLKRVQASPEKLEVCGVSRPENVEGYPNLGDGREWWTVQDGYFAYEGQPEMFEGGTYILDYYWLTKDLVDSVGDLCELPAESHQYVVLRAAYLLGRDAGMFDRVKVLQEELAEWESDLEIESGRLLSLRPQILQPKKIRFGSLGWAMDRVQQTFMSRSTSKTPDFWTEARIRPEIQNAVWWFQLEAIRFFQDLYTQRVTQVPNENVFPLPSNFIREKQFYRIVNNTAGSRVPVDIVPLSEARVSGISALGYATYPSSFAAPKETWSINGRALVANTEYTLSESYELVYSALLEEMEHSDDSIQVPTEHLEIVTDRAIETTGQRYGETPIALEYGEKYRATLREKAQDALAIRAVSQRRTVRDAMGYELDNFGSSGGWPW